MTESDIETTSEKSLCLQLNDASTSTYSLRDQEQNQTEIDPGETPFTPVTYRIKRFKAIPVLVKSSQANEGTHSFSG